ncbi:MAG: DEAD/DEAH box helicase [Actinobacteria bacterium]|nr:DEAD/DEAH box helicase [Actinomycetota bacterium]
MAGTLLTLPEAGHLVRVRGQQWVVTNVRHSHLPQDEIAAHRLPGRTLVTLASVSDDDLGDELTVVWEIEPGREVVPASQLPEVTETGWDDPQELGAFLDAVRWGTVASADTTTLQAPFRSGITIEEYQLEPVARALAMPRVNLLIADDVGLGKTIEAGLVAQEMLLRHRARRIIVVCPAPLTLKWREEMAEKFGLDFAVLSAAALRELRRSHGLQANPFTVHPRTIISLPWLRTPRVQRLLDEVLTPQARHPGFFDLLIVDEAHHCAPPAPRRGNGYAVDSLQTQAVRRLGEHSQHRLFLSATPHNGYSESWQALLEILDPQRFARGVEPDRAAVDQVMVRRLKDTLRKPDGTPRFPGRVTRAVEVDYPEQELRAHALLTRYLASRRRAAARASTDGDRTRGNDLVALLLKKRLFSSPAAFAHTLAAHAESVAGGTASGTPAPVTLPDWYDDVLGWDEALLDDETGTEAERALLDQVAAGEPGADEDETSLLTELQDWVDRHAAPADAKATALIAELDRVVRPGGDWSMGERVIVFTEYVDTQTWLAGLLHARGLGGDRLGLLHGGMDERRREHLKAAFQATPDRHPIRILLATDAASEGIDLQRHCHRVIHYDIPFNPNRLEQRIGRVDRHGQHHTVEVAHFVGSGWQHAAAGSQEADLEFLARVATKVATERADLGSVNPVLATAVEARMLGRPVLVDPTTVTAKPTTQLLRAERDLREQAQRLRAQLDISTRRLHVAPPNVRRVVDVALRLAGQPPLVEADPLRPAEIAPPTLRSGWERTVVDLADPLSGEPRPLTFDGAVAAERDDIVLAHLEHPLVAHSTRLLRSAIWGGRTALRRVAAVRATLPAGTDVDGPLVAVFSRLVVIGADGTRLHEEVMLTGRLLPADPPGAAVPDGSRARGRSRRLELDAPRNAAVRDAVEAALEPSACHPAPESSRARLAAEWDTLKDPLAQDVRVRAEERVASLTRTLTRRAEEDTRRVNGVFDQLAAMLRGALAGDGVQQRSLDELLAEERQQWERDRAAWQARLDDLPEERDRELAAVTARYAGVRDLVFPFAVALIVPELTGPEVAR